MADRLVPADHADIGAALAVAGNGDRVLDSRAAGTYAEALSAYEALNNIQILPQNTGIILALGGSYMKCGAGWIVGTDLIGYSISNTVAGQPTIMVDSWTGAKTVVIKNCVITRSAAGRGTILVTASGGNATSLTLNDCTVSHTGGLDAIEQVGVAGAVPTIIINRGQLGPAARGVELAAPALNLTVRRAMFLSCSAAGVASNAGAVAGTWSVRECISKGAGAGPLLDWNSTGAAVIDFSANTIISGGVGIKRTSATNIHATSTIADNWADTMERPNGAYDWDYNGYRVLALGAAGANDVVTLADPGFVDMAGGDYRLAAGSILRDAGVANGDATDFGGFTRVSGLAQDIGAYEYQVLDCGVSSVASLSSLACRVTLVATGGGSAVPVEAQATDTAKWTITMAADPALAIVRADKVSPYVYDLTMQHRMEPPGSLYEVDASAIATDMGGLCDDPGTGQAYSIGDVPDARLPTVGLNDCTLGPVASDGYPIYPSGAPPRRPRAT